MADTISTEPKTIQPNITKPEPLQLNPDARLGMLETNITKLSDVVSQKLSIIDSIAKTLAILDTTVKKGIQSLPVPDKVKDAISYIWEYVLLFFVILFSVGAGFGWVSFTSVDWDNLSKLAFILVGCILIGYIKTQYQNYLQTKEKNVQSLKIENDSLKTALNTNAFMMGNTQAELMALKDFCRNTIQDFNTQWVWKPRYEITSVQPEKK